MRLPEVEKFSDRFCRFDKSPAYLGHPASHVAVALYRATLRVARVKWVNWSRVLTRDPRDHPNLLTQLTRDP